MEPSRAHMKRASSWMACMRSLPLLRSAVVTRWSARSLRWLQVSASGSGLFEHLHEPEHSQAEITSALREAMDDKFADLQRRGSVLPGAREALVGGFGSDDMSRPRLVAHAQRRASAKFGVTFDETTTVLVGDTVRDVQAAKLGGARVIAVATGIDSAAKLAAEGADVVLNDLYG